jgi:hypothetical protein
MLKKAVMAVIAKTWDKGRDRPFDVVPHEIT